METTKGYGRKIAEEVIDWAVPVVCAGAILIWQDMPQDVRHYWPVICLAVMDVYLLAVTAMTRREVRRLRRAQEAASAKAELDKTRDDNIAKAFRAMLDDNMGTLYALCIERGYTTEDERRRYERMQKAYEALGGNGEAKRRKARFDGIDDEETWLAGRSDRTTGA